ncbi:MAG: hypothetical protein MUP41_07925 [Desulfobacterales bacterium]|nr:hypothetical protein [Desulfobacterales bacterium]
MSLATAHKLIKKLYYEVKRQKSVNQEEVNLLAEFLEKNRYKVLILREYGVSYNPEDKTLTLAHYPIEVYGLYGYLHCENYQAEGVENVEKSPFKENTEEDLRFDGKG